MKFLLLCLLSFSLCADSEVVSLNEKPVVLSQPKEINSIMLDAQPSETYFYWGSGTRLGVFPDPIIGFRYAYSNDERFDVSVDAVLYSSKFKVLFSNILYEKRMNDKWSLGCGVNIAGALLEYKDYTEVREGGLVFVQPIFSGTKKIGKESFLRITTSMYVKPIYLHKDVVVYEKYSGHARFAPLGISICTSV